MAKPTLKQINYLTNLGLWIPDTKAIAGRLISYAVNGNGTGGNKHVRIGYANYFYSYWVNSLVRHTQWARSGVVKRVAPLYKDEVADAGTLYSVEHVYPFMLGIVWENRTKMSPYRPPIYIEKIEQYDDICEEAEEEPICSII